jgi:hypothetical protein
MMVIFALSFSAEVTLSPAIQINNQKITATDRTFSAIISQSMGMFLKITDTTDTTFKVPCSTAGIT